MKKRILFVTGYFGAPIRMMAEIKARNENVPLIYLDEEIEKSDGRSALRICMSMGEHEYRNKEYEMLTKITGETAGESDAHISDDSHDPIHVFDIHFDLVVCCGDGVLNDEMSRELILRHYLLFAGIDMSPKQLWRRALDIDEPIHAFMYFGSEEEKEQAFYELYERQQKLYESISARFLKKADSDVLYELLHELQQ